MRSFGFSEKWLQLIEQCLSTVSYSILINGCPFGLIKPSRGLRKGDPLSPFLFILGTEILSHMIVRAESLGLIHDTKISRAAPPISHLLFADDIMIFTRAFAAEASAVVNIIFTYKGWSGQTINLSKSSISFSKNVQQSCIDTLSSLVGIKHSAQPGCYLSLPLIIPRSKRQAFLALKDKMLKRISRWKSKLLSQAGRACLMKSVVSVLSTYFMSNFLLPQQYCWNLILSYGSSGGVSSRKNQKLCASCLGGSLLAQGFRWFGFRLLFDYNRAHSSKLGWHLCSRKKKFWVQVIHAKYGSPDMLSILKSSSSASWWWHGI
ncbi:hypothetical protein CJ030_MR2G016682 [Morella rubra]|uniref:Reverse transcriptase domain-containing protein n=1 Tax=Morella rubra TaxID=262757 RepID=A0A6A1WFT6_9ROSI|nr:hypothetical protein CJ030_MR2G016682 [Morella rubra]